MILTLKQREHVKQKLEEIRQMVGAPTSADELAAAAYGATELARDLNCWHHEAQANSAGVVSREGAKVQKQKTEYLSADERR